VESAKILTPNLLTFILVTGNERFYCMGIYIPPADMGGEEDLQATWDACPDDCMPLVLGDLHINFSDPQDKRDEVIRDLLDDVGLANASKRYTPRRPRRQSTRA
jgi:hypothetical protein